ncbi:hypothetical protein [Rhizobium sp. BK068]|uniref:hypothetical protein n=1 Tax=Rhizobium sp. BK068 TaxID=2512130 RepID=UPI001049EFBC|nr:hypothetical protein [Rhizobium sp. BK068]TCM62268.1 hypothetical protein EV291_15419 [Rhizobium sp. BK068]
MLPSLPRNETERLKKLILMLSSEHEGERQVALSKISLLLSRRHLDWHDLAAALTTMETGRPARPKINVQQSQDGRYRIAATNLLHLVAAIRSRASADSYQLQFLDSMEDRAASYSVVLLSPRQLAYLTRLWEEM